MSETVNWRLPGEALDLPRIQRLAEVMAERAGLEFHWYELDPDAEEVEFDEQAPSPPPTGKGFVNVVFAFALKRRLDVLWKVDPARMPRDLAAVDATFLPASECNEYMVELTFLRDLDPSGSPHCRLWVDGDDGGNREAWPVALALASSFAQALGGILERGDRGSEQSGGRT
jgi:hypothetical protein